MTRSHAPGVAAAIAYAEDVMAGRVEVCELVQLACRRFLLDKERADAGLGQWDFRPDLAEAALDQSEVA